MQQRRTGWPVRLCLSIYRWAADLADGRRGVFALGRDAHGAAAAVRAERHLARDQREQGVVAAPAHVDARVEVRTTLPDDDLACVHALAAETLDPKPLSVGVTAVPAGRGALLVCHVSSSPSQSSDLVGERDIDDWHSGGAVCR